MDRLGKLESRAIHIIREAYSEFSSLCLLWSIGKGSTLMLYLARKAFLGTIPFPLVHINTSFEIPEMIAYRDRLAFKWQLDLIYGQNSKALEDKETYPDGNCSRLQCCNRLKVDALANILSSNWPRYRLNHDTGKFELDRSCEAYNAVIVGSRTSESEEPSDERYFSLRSGSSKGPAADQMPAFWSLYQTNFPKGTHVRIHPLLDWTELDIWEYIEREQLPTTPLYYDRGDGTRYRSLGCEPCIKPVESTAADADDIIKELKACKIYRVSGGSTRSEKRKKADGASRKIPRSG